MMDIEELNKVAEIINSLGESASDGFLYWLGADVLIEIIGYAVLICVVVIASRLVKDVFSTVDYDDKNYKFVQFLRDEMGVGSSGPIIDSERDGMIEFVRKAKEES